MFIQWLWLFFLFLLSEANSPFWFFRITRWLAQSSKQLFFLLTVFVLQFLCVLSCFLLEDGSWSIISSSQSMFGTINGWLIFRYFCVYSFFYLLLLLFYLYAMLLNGFLKILIWFKWSFLFLILSVVDILEYMFQLFLNIQSKLVSIEITVKFSHIDIVLASILTCAVVRPDLWNVCILLFPLCLTSDRGSRSSIFYFGQFELRILVGNCLETVFVVLWNNF